MGGAPWHPVIQKIRIAQTDLLTSGCPIWGDSIGWCPRARERSPRRLFSRVPQHVGPHACAHFFLRPLGDALVAGPHRTDDTQQLQQVAVTGGSYYNMCNTRSTFATLRWNTCNIRQKSWNTCNICLKHLQNTWKTLESHCKHMQHWDETPVTNVWNTWKLETYAWNMHVYVISRSIFATSR
jgi:hypothetical protein